MREQLIGFLNTFEDKVFAGKHLPVIYARDSRRAPNARPLIYVEDPGAVKPSFHAYIIEGEVPKEGGWYICFPDIIEEYLTYSPVEATLGLWSLGVLACWRRVQKEQGDILNAKGPITKQSQLDALLLTVPELARGAEPYQLFDEAAASATLDERIAETWKTRGIPLVQKGMQESVALWNCKRDAEADMIAAIVLWCRTEDNVIEYLLRMKDLAFSKAHSQA